MHDPSELQSAVALHSFSESLYFCQQMHPGREKSTALYENGWKRNNTGNSKINAASDSKRFKNCYLLQKMLHSLTLALFLKECSIHNVKKECIPCMSFGNIAFLSIIFKEPYVCEQVHCFWQTQNFERSSLPLRNACSCKNNVCFQETSIAESKEDVGFSWVPIESTSL